jgi:apolipoprotein N-acyltransferase
MEDFTTQTETPKEDLKTKAAHLKSSVTDYARSYTALMKARATRGASNAAAGTVIGVLSLVFGVFFLMFLFTALGFWLGDVLDSRAGGFFCVAGFFALLIALLFGLRRKVIVPMIRNLIIRKVYE